MRLDHQIFMRWPTQRTDRLQLLSAPTPNGVKAGITLEETGLEYEPHRIEILADENHDPAFLARSTDDKTPAIDDPGGSSSAPLALFDSGALLFSLTYRTRQFVPADPSTRYEAIQRRTRQMARDLT